MDATQAEAWAEGGLVNIAEVMRGETAPEYFVDGLVVKGVVNSFVGAAESGKSWLALQLVTARCLGQSVFGEEPQPPAKVLYLDYENNEVDLRQRLSDLGYEADTPFENLIYFVQPDISSLDTEAGGEDLQLMLDEFKPDVVVIDTLARCLSGSENDADTFNALNRNALMRMKGLTVILLDHFGHEQNHARGSSAKRQLWSAEWHVKRYMHSDTYLSNEKDRRGWLPQVLTLKWEGGYFTLERPVAEATVEEVAAKLDELGVPRDYGKKKVREWLAANSKKDSIRCRNDVLQAAVNIRKQTKPVRAAA